MTNTHTFATWILQLPFKYACFVTYVPVYPSLYSSVNISFMFDAFKKKLQALVHFTPKHFSMHTINWSSTLFSVIFLLINLNIIKCTKFKFTSQCVLTNANICATPMPIKIQNIIVTQNVSSWSIPTPPHRKSLWFFFYHRSFYLPFEYVFTV